MKFVAFLVLLTWLLTNAVTEFHQIAWGTGVLLGGFSPLWGGMFLVFTLACLAGLAATLLFLFNARFQTRAAETLIRLRDRLGGFRWVLWLGIFLFPLFFLQFTYWGIVFQKEAIRLLLWVLVTALMTYLAGKGQLASWRPFLISLVLTASLFSVAASLRLANNYPFAQGWSEGNRLWDYSILFGRDRYDYPADKRIPVFLDFGRQLVGGLVFLLPNVGIYGARIWVGLIQILPYFLLGAAIFRFEYKNKLLWFLLTLWTFLFLKQGPIHPPLVISAVLVALAWRSNLWLAIPLVILSGYFAEESRFTWVFAAGLWIGMLELAGASLSDGKLSRAHWARAITLGISGLFGGLLLSSVLSFIRSAFTVAVPVAAGAGGQSASGQAVSASISIEGIIYAITHQPLLWYRLLPNSTYGNGILLGLAFAVLPVIALLVWLHASKKWTLNIWQKLVILGPLAAFLVVGLVASTKIGGGGDLHNLDMFLIGLLFTVALAWFNGGRAMVLNVANIPDGMKVILVLTLVLSSLTPLQAMRSFRYEGDIERLRILTDLENPKALDVLPSQQVVAEALQIIQTEVDIASLQGEVLFMDQRQLLTFDYVTNIPLVPEYDKKLLMDEAMADDILYFQNFYIDLAARRFSLIVSEILREAIKDGSYEFGEENNAWVKWVSTPLLCYYEPKVTLREVGIQLLVPKQDTSGCAELLPWE